MEMKRQKGIVLNNPWWVVLVGSSVLLVAMLVVLLAGSVMPHTIAGQPSPHHALRSARDRAQDAGSYQFTADIEQTLLPRAIPSMVGEQEQRSDMRTEGAVTPNTMNLTIRAEDAHMAPATIVQHDGETFLLREGTLAPADSPSSLAAPGMDYMGYLDAATAVERLEPQQVGDTTYARYRFDISGDTLALQVRDHMQEEMHGQLPPGAKLAPSPMLQRMGGSGELWIDERGLPARQILDITLPGVDEAYDAVAHIETTFRNFGAVETIREPVQGEDGTWHLEEVLMVSNGPRAPPLSSPDGADSSATFFSTLTHQAQRMLTSSEAETAGYVLFALVAGALSVFTLLRLYRRNPRRVYSAIVKIIIVIFVTQPLLQGAVTNKYHTRLAHAAEQEADTPTAAIPASIAQPRQPGLSNDGSLSPLNASSEYPYATTCGDGSAANDSDNDGLDDLTEGCLGTDPYMSDTDNDTISDAQELEEFTVGSQSWNGNPLAADTNLDGLTDNNEWPAAYGGYADSWDPDNDGIPNIWDEDNDNDGVSDGYDAAPFSATDYSTKISFQMRDSGTFDGYQYVKVQVQPENTNHLRYSLSPLDWPYDEEGQFTDLDDSSEDVRLVPMLIITTNEAPGSYLADKYGLLIDDSDTDIVMYTPLTPVYDNGQITTFQTRLAYGSEDLEDIQWEMELGWMVQMDVDSYTDETIVTEESTIVTYDDSFRVTGLEISRSSDVELGLFGTPKDKTEDSNLFRLLAGLNTTFLAGEDMEGQSANSMLEELTTVLDNSAIDSSEKFGIPAGPNIATDYATYRHIDEAMADLTQSRIFQFLSSNGYDTPTTDEMCSTSTSDETFPCASVVVAMEQKTGTYSMDDMGGITPTLNNASINLDSDDFIMSTVRNVKLNMYEYRAGTWDAIASEDIESIMRDRYDLGALAQSLQASYPDVTYADLYYWLLAGYTAWNSGQSSIIALNDTTIVDTVVAQSDIDTLVARLDAAFSGTLPQDLFIYAYNAIQSTFETTSTGDVMEILETIRSGLARQVLHEGIEALSAVGLDVTVLQPIAEFVDMVVTETGPDDVSSLMDEDWAKYTYLALMIVYRPAAFVLAVVAAVKLVQVGGTIALFGKAGLASNFKGLGGAIGSALAVIGLAFALYVAWSEYDAVMAQATTDYQRTAALVQAITATVVAVILFVLAFVPGVWVVMSFIYLLDFILTTVTGGKITIIDSATRAIASVIYMYDILTMIDSDSIDFAGAESELETPEDGMVVGNRFIYKDTFTAEFEMLHYAATTEDIKKSGAQGRYSGTISNSSNQVENNNQDEDCQGYNSGTGPYRHDDVWNATRCENDMAVEIDLTEARRNVMLTIEWEIEYWFRYKECWVFGADCDTETEHESIPSEKATDEDKEDYKFDVYLDVLPQNLDDFWTWSELTNNDADADGLADSDEAALGASTSLWDTDGDGLSDGYEYDQSASLGTDLTLWDTDGDGLSDRQELFIGTTINQSDSDSDGVLDGDEIYHRNQDGSWSGGWAVQLPGSTSVRMYGNPTMADGDVDGMDDGVERDNNFSPYAYNDGPRLTVDVTPVEISPDGEKAAFLAPGETVELDMALLSVGAEPINEEVVICLPTLLTSVNGAILYRNGSSTELIPTRQDDSSAECGTRYTWDFSTDNLLLLQGETISTTLQATVDPALVNTTQGEIAVTVGYDGGTLQETAMLKVDRDTPSVAITAPADGDILSGSSYVVGGTAGDTTSWIETVEVVLPAASDFTAAEGDEAWASTWTLPADGTYTVRARATDYKGNTSNEDTVTVLVDNTPPTISTSIVDGSFVAVNQEQSTVALNGSASDQLAGLARLQIRIDSGAWQTISMAESAPTSYNWSYTWNLDGESAQGDHTIALRAWDEAGHMSSIERRTVVVDLVPPGSLLLDAGFTSDDLPLVKDTSELDLDGYVNDLANVPDPLEERQPLSGNIDPINDASVWLEVSSVEDTSAGLSAVWLGDINGDGRSDLAVGMPGSDDGAGRVAILYGRGGDWPVQPDSEAIADSSTSFVGASGAGIGAYIAAAGDVNGDGYDDFMIGDPTNNRVFLVFGHGGQFGRDQSLTEERVGAWSILSPPEGEQIGSHIAAAGNVNGDEFQDVLISTSSGNTYVLAGHTSPWTGTTDIANDYALLVSTGSTAVAAGVGDIDGDLYDDFAIADPAGSGVYLFSGSSDYTKQAALSFSLGDGQNLGGSSSSNTSIAALGDVSDDGQDDFIFSSGSAPVLVLGHDGSGSISSVALGGYTATPDRFVAAAGDVDGQGRNDIIIGVTDGGDKDAYLLRGEDFNGSQSPVFPVHATFEGVDQVASAPHIAVADLNCDDSSDVLLIPIEATTDRYLPDGLGYSSLPTLEQQDLPSYVGEDSDGASAGQLSIAPLSPANSTVAVENWYFVDDDYCATCDNDGYIWNDTAFATIQDALNAASLAENAQITVRPGVYDPFTVDPTSNMGENYVSIVGTSADAVFINGGGSGTGVSIANADGIALSNMTIRNVDVGVRLSSAGEDGHTNEDNRIILDHLLIDDFTTYGIESDRTSTVYIQHSTLAGDESATRIYIDPVGSSISRSWADLSGDDPMPETGANRGGLASDGDTLVAYVGMPQYSAYNGFYSMWNYRYTPSSGWETTSDIQSDEYWDSDTRIIPPLYDTTNLTPLTDDGNHVFALSGEGATGTIHTIHVHGDYVIVGGEFTHVRNSSGRLHHALNLGRYRISTDNWYSQNAGVDGPIYDLDTDDIGHLLVGGDFDHEYEYSGNFGTNGIAPHGNAASTYNSPNGDISAMQLCGPNGDYDNSIFGLPGPIYAVNATDLRQTSFGDAFVFGGDFDANCGGSSSNIIYYKDTSEGLTNDGSEFGGKQGWKDYFNWSATPPTDPVVAIVRLGEEYDNGYDSLGKDWAYHYVATYNFSSGASAVYEYYPGDQWGTYTPSDPVWDNLNLGFNGRVRKLALDESSRTLYIVGDFTSPHNGIMTYNIDTGATGGLGSGLNGPVYDIALNGSDVYVGGQFSQAGGVTVDGVAKWNGSGWESVGADVVPDAGSGASNSTVSAIFFNSNRLYIAGDFEQVVTSSGTTLGNIAYLDTTTDEWHMLGSAMTPSTYWSDLATKEWYGWEYTTGDVIASPAAQASDGTHLYVTEQSTTNLYRYENIIGTRTLLNSGAPTPGDGSTMIAVDSTLYLFQGGSNGFYSYAIDSDTWTQEADAPFSGAVGSGADFAWDGGFYLYATRGDSTKEFARFNTASRLWESLEELPGVVNDGAGLAMVAGNLYATSGDGSSNFYVYAGVGQGDIRMTLQENAFVAPESAANSVWIAAHPNAYEDYMVDDGGGNQWVSSSSASWTQTTWETPITHSTANLVDTANSVYRTSDGSTLTAGYYTPDTREVYVSPNFCATCDNDGLTWNVDAFTSIQKAMNSGAQRVYVRAGIYRETLTLHNGVEVIGAGADSTIIKSPVGSSASAIVSASGINARLSRVSLVGDGSIDGLIVNSDAISVTLSRSIVRDTDTAIWLDGSATNTEITNNTIVNNQSGVEATNCARINVRNNTFAYQSGAALDFSDPNEPDLPAACSGMLDPLHTYNAYWKNGNNFTVNGNVVELSEPGIVVEDPQFENASAHNYRPDDDSALAGAGSPYDPVPPGTGSSVDIGYMQDGRASLYVDKDYCETCDNDGLEWQVEAFSSIQDAINTAETDVTTTACGVVIEDESSCYQLSIGVAAGTYNENITMKSRVKLVGSGANQTFVRSTDGSAVFTIDDAHHVSIHGLSIENASSSAGVLVDNGSHTISMTHNLIHSNQHGIIFRNGSSGEVSFSTIADHTSGAGVAADGDNTWINVNNSILSNNQDGLYTSNNGQIFSSYNLLYNTSQDYRDDAATGLSEGTGDMVGLDPLLDASYLPGLSSPALDTADPLETPAYGGGSHADLGYTEVAAVPIVILPGAQQQSCAEGNSGVKSVSLGSSHVSDATTPIDDTHPDTWNTATLKSPGDGASYWENATLSATQDGLHRIYARATDQQDNVTEDGAEYVGAFILDSTPPEITLTTANPTDVADGAAILLQAEVKDYAPTGSGTFFAIDEIYFDVDGKKVIAQWSDPDWEADHDTQTARAFEAWVPLTSSSNDVTAFAIDRAGNVGGSSSATVTTSGNDVVTISSHEASDAASTENVTIEGYVRFASTSGGNVRVRVTGSDTTVYSATLEYPGQISTAWSADIVLDEGEGTYTVQVDAKSSGSYGPAQTITIAYDTSKPVINATSPDNGSYVGATVNLSGSVSDSNGIDTVSLSFDDGCTWEEANLSGDTWDGAWTPAGGGDNQSYSFLVRVTDKAGNATIEKRRVVVDTTPPDGLTPVSFNYPEGSYLDDITYSLVMTWTDVIDESGSSSVQVRVNQTSNDTPDSSDTPTSPDTNQHSAALDASGEWYVHIGATDAAGNRINQTYGPWYVSDKDSTCQDRVKLLDFDGYLDIDGDEWSSTTEMLDDDERSGQTQQLYTAWDGTNVYLGWQGARWKLDGRM